MQVVSVVVTHAVDLDFDDEDEENGELSVTVFDNPDDAREFAESVTVRYDIWTVVPVVGSPR